MVWRSHCEKWENLPGREEIVNFENIVEINDLNVTVAPICSVCVFMCVEVCLFVYLFFPKTVARKRVGFIQLGFGYISVCKNYL